MAKILLIGGNSVIGRALARGVMRRTDSDEIICVSRKAPNQEIKGYRSIITDDYLNFDFSELLGAEKIVAVVLAFGVLDRQEGDFLVSLERNYEVNVFMYLRVLSKVISNVANNEGKEIHITSSVLSDFTREEVAAYSFSKQTMQSVAELLLQKHSDQTFFWKFAYVDSPLNNDRVRSPIFTTPESIETAAFKRAKGGTYYVPQIARIPSRFLFHFPRLKGLVGR
jgi:hypothetical protein